MVEHTTHNRAVAGSIPASATTLVEAIRASGLIPPGTRVLAAVSGGPDSTALLLALHALGHDVVAAHFDHALRADSAEDAAFVRALAAARRIPLIEERRTAPLPRSQSLQAAARDLRYDFLDRARRQAGAELIATAHTRDDHVETILINLLRGARIAGLRGIPSRRGAIVRPLLQQTRADIDAYLAEAGVTARQDPSNANLRFLRARVRHLLIPALARDVPDLPARLLRIAALAAAVDTPTGRAAELRALYERAAGRAPALGRGHLSAMERLLDERRTGASLALPKGLTFTVLPNGTPRIGPAPTAAPAPVLLERPCPGCTEDGAIHLPEDSPTPTLATRQTRPPGLRVRNPNGLAGHSKKLQDLFTDAKVPRHERDTYPLVFLGDDLIWVPGLARDTARTVPRSRPGRHVWLGRGSANPVVRSEHQSPRSRPL